MDPIKRIGTFFSLRNYQNLFTERTFQIREDLTGTFVAINTSYTLDRKQLIEILRDRFNRVDNTRDQACKFPINLIN